MSRNRTRRLCQRTIGALIAATIIGSPVIVPTAASAATATTTYAAINHSVSHPGAAVVISGVVTPNLHGRPVYLELLTSAGWIVLRHTTLTSTSHYVFSFVLARLGKWTYRVYTSHTTTTAASASRSLTLTSVACIASMSNSQPSQYSSVVVRVGTGPSASVLATAHYKTTTTSHTGTANSAGSATITFYISRATIGYRVLVSVGIQWGGVRATCSTAFTPA
jgi:hypothetical protein